MVDLYWVAHCAMLVDYILNFEIIIYKNKNLLKYQIAATI